MELFDASVGDTGGAAIVFTAAGVWIYDHHRNANLYMNAHQALAVADEIIAKYKDARGAGTVFIQDPAGLEFKPGKGNRGDT